MKYSLLIVYLFSCVATFTCIPAEHLDHNAQEFQAVLKAMEAAALECEVSSVVDKLVNDVEFAAAQKPPISQEQHIKNTLTARNIIFALKSTQIPQVRNGLPAALRRLVCSFTPRVLTPHTFVHPLPRHEGCSQVQFIPDGSGIVAIDNRGLLFTCDRKGSRLASTETGTCSRLLRVSPNGQLVATKGKKGEVQLRNLAFLDDCAPQNLDGNFARDYRFLFDSKRLLAAYYASTNRTLKIHDVETAVPVLTWNVAGASGSVACSCYDDNLIATSMANKINVVDIRTPTQEGIMIDSPCNDMLFVTDKQMAVVTDDFVVRVDIRAPHNPAQPIGPGFKCYLESHRFLAASRDGRILAAAGYVGNDAPGKRERHVVRVWDLAKGEKVVEEDHIGGAITENVDITARGDAVLVARCQGDPVRGLYIEQFSLEDTRKTLMAAQREAFNNAKAKSAGPGPG